LHPRVKNALAMGGVLFVADFVQSVFFYSYAKSDGFNSSLVKNLPYDGWELSKLAAAAMVVSLVVGYAQDAVKEYFNLDDCIDTLPEALDNIQASIEESA